MTYLKTYFVLLDHLISRHSFARNSLKRLKRKIYLMDASIIPLCLQLFDWAKYRSTKGAVKLHTVGTSENAVQIQIWTALMAILLLKFLKDKAQYEWNLSNLITFVRLNLFVKISLEQWLNFPFYQSGSTPENNQLSFFDG